MPLYTYEVLDDRGEPTGERFEELESIKAPALERDSQGRPCRRAFVGCNIERQWHGKETRSLSLGVNPEQIAQAKARAPSWEFDPATGDAIFTSDRQMRRALKDQAAADKRDQEREAERQAKERTMADATARAPAHRTDIPSVAEVIRRSAFAPVEVARGPTNR